MHMYETTIDCATRCETFADAIIQLRQKAAIFGVEDTPLIDLTCNGFAELAMMNAEYAHRDFIVHRVERGTP